MSMLMIMCTTVSQQTMRMVGAIMQNFVHHDVNYKSAPCCNKHSHWLLYKLPSDNTISRLIHHKEDKYPNDKNIGYGTKQFHSMVAKTHLFSGSPLGEVEEDERSGETNCV
jgi:hypothetical protein